MFLHLVIYPRAHLSGEKKIQTNLNFTSLWLNDTLYMFTWESVLSSTPSCVQLDMGFGMVSVLASEPHTIRKLSCPPLPFTTHSITHPGRQMKPDWFSTDSNQSGLVWNAKKSDFYDTNYHRTIMTVKDAGQGGPYDDEVFTYYSYFNNETGVDNANGAPFLMCVSPFLLPLIGEFLHNLWHFFIHMRARTQPPNLSPPSPPVGMPHLLLG